MLFDATISPYRLLATAGWLIAFAIVIMEMFIDRLHGLGHLGLLIGGASATLNVHGFIHSRECRERRAFEVGQEVGLRSIE